MRKSFHLSSQKPFETRIFVEIVRGVPAIHLSSQIRVQLVLAPFPDCPQAHDPSASKRVVCNLAGQHPQSKASESSPENGKLG